MRRCRLTLLRLMCVPRVLSWPLFLDIKECAWSLGLRVGVFQSMIRCCVRFMGAGPLGSLLLFRSRPSAHPSINKLTPRTLNLRLDTTVNGLSQTPVLRGTSWGPTIGSVSREFVNLFVSLALVWSEPSTVLMHLCPVRPVHWLAGCAGAASVGVASALLRLCAALEPAITHTQSSRGHRKC